MQIQPGTLVTIRYQMKNQLGEIIDNTMAGPPISYVHGTGTIAPALETSLWGAKPNETKSLTVSLNNQNYHFDIFVEDVRQANNQELKSGKPSSSTCTGEGCC